MSIAVPARAPRIPDDQFRIFDQADPTKIIAFEASGIASGNTRTITMPDEDVTLAGRTTIEINKYTGDGALSQVINLVDLTITPSLVFIWANETVDNTVTTLFFTSGDYVDENASGLCLDLNASRARIDRIIAVGEGSFTVDDAGGDNHPNMSGQVYQYAVIGKI